MKYLLTSALLIGIAFIEAGTMSHAAERIEVLGPKVHADRSITFSLQAPEADRVEVSGEDGLGAGPFPMKKREDGIWSVTPPPAVPGFHWKRNDSGHAHAKSIRHEDGV